ncbi:hypothetical protein DM860_008480 [Cuscuta australis]|uniref:Uncharacterized protein n=1 Tax=Cuscuta australis TaxID=267555 RepID=A0A328D4Q0_9ASTE|nr:hypothetical protein DM860_008480 [Cuscuta australis]
MIVINEIWGKNNKEPLDQLKAQKKHTRIWRNDKGNILNKGMRPLATKEYVSTTVDGLESGDSFAQRKR